MLFSQPWCSGRITVSFYRKTISELSTSIKNPGQTPVYLESKCQGLDILHPSVYHMLFHVHIVVSSSFLCIFPPGHYGCSSESPSPPTSWWKAAVQPRATFCSSESRLATHPLLLQEDELKPFAFMKGRSLLCVSEQSSECYSLWISLKNSIQWEFLSLPLCRGTR